MDDPSIENRRFEVDQNTALGGIASQFAKAFGYTAELSVDPALSQLLAGSRRPEGTGPSSY